MSEIQKNLLTGFGCDSYRITMPPAAARIIHKLQEAGYEAYIVGGCVRDCILGREPGDWDITTSALPHEVKALFRRTIDTGIQHGTVTIMDGDEGYEVTTYRLDGDYEDGRHPTSVSFTRSLVEDLKRRDFTINAMAYNDKDGLVDEFDGIGDLQRGVIRCVGRARERFGEDALRIMRAVRFSAQLGFSIDKETLDAISELAPTLDKISKERIQIELNKLLLSKNPGYFRVLYETGITKVIMPEFDTMMEYPQSSRFHSYTVGMHTLKTVEAVPEDLVLRMTMLLHDVSKVWTGYRDEEGLDHFYKHASESAKWAEKFLRGLKYDNYTIDRVVKLIRWHNWRINSTKKDVRKAMSTIGEELFPDFIMVCVADTMGKSDYAKALILPELGDIADIAAEILRDGDCLTLKDLAVTGRDLIAAGMKPGPHMGVVLNGLLQLVLEDPSCNNKEYLLGRVNLEHGALKEV